MLILTMKDLYNCNRKNQQYLRKRFRRKEFGRQIVWILNSRRARKILAELKGKEKRLRGGLEITSFFVDELSQIEKEIKNANILR